MIRPAFRTIAAALLACAAPVLGAAADTPAAALSASQTALVAKARALGATDVAATPGPNGGLILGGKLEGDQFALAFPASWNHQGLLFAHGYSTPGTPVAVAEDPVAKGPGGGVFADAYGQGYAVGHSAYDKAGLGVETGVKNTVRLRDFLTRLGTKRTYVMGDSMGGGIVVALLDLYPKSFAGGFARCGVVDSWQTLFGQLIDMRLAYNFLTIGTPYALPGVQDARRSALPTDPPSPAAAQGYLFGQIGKVATPILALWNAAQKNPNGREARIVSQVAAIGGFDRDAASIAFPLVTASLGADDMAATAGGQVYGNIGKVYASQTMTAEEAAALNAGVQRIAADPAALTYLTHWHKATGRLRVPLVTLHNRIDSLVPFAQEQALANTVAQAKRTSNLIQYDVAPVRAPLPVGGVDGYTHCGFDKVQTLAGWNALRGWVETGKRPAADAVK
ncbi:hypothetical protein G4G27_16355 [Sphingomonas sp. So64.6b]|uniref:alpha/beta hydrolase family protein n=1 Tax=Sphingomonas sp. So64.6b TaxID=2997354 RepID=UPI001602C7A8|nr:hypothetical protein [Sphingomonas sp. So64.6b]QNA85391.1 hypothetical protein G4G27_16355 [Sphingomonas sp. So64.6b]